MITTEQRKDLDIENPMDLNYLKADKYEQFFDTDKVILERDFDENILILRGAKVFGPHWYSL